MSVTELIDTLRSLMAGRASRATTNVTLWVRCKLNGSFYKVFAREIKVDETGIHVEFTELN